MQNAWNMFFFSDTCRWLRCVWNKSIDMFLKHVRSARKFKISKCGLWYIRDSCCIVQGLSDNVRGEERQTWWSSQLRPTTMSAAVPSPPSSEQTHTERQQFLNEYTWSLLIHFGDSERFGTSCCHSVKLKQQPLAGRLELFDWLWNVFFFIRQLPQDSPHIHMTRSYAKCTAWIQTQSEAGLSLAWHRILSRLDPKPGK